MVGRIQSPPHRVTRRRCCLSSNVYTAGGLWRMRLSYDGNCASTEHCAHGYHEKCCAIDFGETSSGDFLIYFCIPYVACTCVHTPVVYGNRTTEAWNRTRSQTLISKWAGTPNGWRPLQHWRSLISGCLIAYKKTLMYTYDVWASFSDLVYPPTAYTGRFLQ